jgi:protoporphyrin/coproporphyrin ferrochelatase
MPPFDAVLVISFGGPSGPGDVRAFLANVLRGRRVTAERIEEVARHYRLFGGVSPITELTGRQAAGLETRLAASGHRLPVYVGMRNWHPFLSDTLSRMSDDGVRRAIGFIMAAQHSHSSCGQYRQNVLDARARLVQDRRADVEVTYVPDWHANAGFVDVVAARVRAAIDRLPAALQSTARLVFTAHSIPMSMAATSRYARELDESSRLVAERLGRIDWALVYQSRSGRPEDPWLEPDVCDYLRAERGRGLEAAVLVPIGFVCDHIEVLYDLDHEAAAVCRAIGVTMTRAETVNDHPRFLQMMAEVTVATIDRYAHGRPLPIAGVTTGA